MKINWNLWLSENEDRRWAEKFYLIYSPVWILQMLIAMIGGFCVKFGDVGLMIVSLLVAMPIYVLPPILYPWKRMNRRFYETFWFKTNCFLTAATLFANYFGSEYFFDALGMVYNFPQLRLNWDSCLLGTGTQTTPVIMYLLTVAYFSTYYVTAGIVLRRVRNSKMRKLYPLAVVAVSFFWVFMETFVMATPIMEGIFWYHNKSAMLTVGTLFYGMEFLTSFPFYASADEGSNHWTVSHAVMYGAGSYMFTLLCYDILYGLIGRIY